MSQNGTVIGLNAAWQDLFCTRNIFLTIGMFEVVVIYYVYYLDISYIFCNLCAQWIFVCVIIYQPPYKKGGKLRTAIRFIHLLKTKSHEI